MISVSNRVIENERSQARGEMLADFLNVEDNDWLSKQEAVLDLLRLLRELREVLRGMRSQRYSQDPKYNRIEFYDLGLNPRAQKLSQAIVKSLSKYAIPPSMGMPHRYPGEAPRLDVGWGVLTLVPYLKSRRGCIAESYAVELLLKLVDEGTLERLRQCLCGCWFWARNKKKTSCDNSCRHKKYEQTEAFKAKHRAYMRTYYQTQKHANVK